MVLRYALAWLFSAMLAACGGGGGGSATPPPVTPTTPPPASFAAVAGVFAHSSTITPAPTLFEARSGTVHVHSDGAITGTLNWLQMTGQARTEEQMTFSGSLSTGQITYTFTLQNPQSVSTQQGAGTIQVSPSAGGPPGITIQFPAANVPFSVKGLTLEKKPLPAVYIGLPLEKLGGWLQFTLQRDGQRIHNAVVRHDVATGTISGSLGPQCDIAGKLYGYDATTGTLRQDWTVSGAGCPVAGTSQMVGQLLGAAVLGTEAAGVIDGKWTVASLSHPLANLPAPFGIVAGTYTAPYAPDRGADVALHPDGTLRITAWRVNAQEPRETATSTFYGRLEGQGPALRAGGDFVVMTELAGATPPLTSIARGTATVDLTPAAQEGQRALAVRISSALAAPVPEFTAILRSAWSLGQPFERLTGLYSRGWLVTAAGPACSSGAACMEGSPMQVRLDASGAMSGAVLENCQLTGRIVGYEQAFGLFRHEVTLQGSGCPVTGTAQLLGEVTSVGRSAPKLALASNGILAGGRFSITLVHEVNLP